MVEFEEHHENQSRKVGSTPELEVTTSSYNGLPVIRIPRYLPFCLGLHVGGRIYLRDSLFKDFQSGQPEIETLSILAHEYTHFARLGVSVREQVLSIGSSPIIVFRKNSLQSVLKWEY